MKKKILLALIISITSVLLFACNKSTTLENSMSEITKIYFSAETEGLTGNISVGEREDPYLIDGKHGKNTDFSLIAIKFSNLLVENQIEVEMAINNVISKVCLELNPANHYYMVDLGYALKEDDEVKLTYRDFSLNFKNISKDFKVGFNNALDLAQKELAEKMEKYYNGKNFEGEGYLKVLTQEDGELFWVLTLVDKDGSKNNVVINVLDGDIIISE